MIPRITVPRRSRRDYLRYKEHARALVMERISFFNTVYGFEIKKIAIKNQKTRWGSCSKKGNLNFNYRIIFLPPAFQDYLIVHELCHIQEFNHGRAFWELVERIVFSYKGIRARLRRFH